MTPQTLQDLTRHIQGHYESFSPQYRLSVRYLLEHPTQVGTLSARRLAALIGVKPATLIRLAHDLGYPGWNDLKAVFIRELQTHESHARRPLTRSTQPDPWLQYVYAQNNGLATLVRTQRAALSACVERLSKAPHIGVAGFHACHPAAFSLRYWCSLFRPDVHLLQNTGGIMQLMLRHLRPEDAVVIVEQAPYAPEATALSEAARDQGAALVALSDSALAPCARRADHHLLYATDSPLGFPSAVALHGLVELLAHALGQHADRAGAGPAPTGRS
ncbi:MurR/RpiR family transcriptional regulator [Castellaniella sp.]|uniref:MurR/RpiR family transcriptional regulator n=1 Tax=Castellaniella sp. TaxID=1955812 RepID=UPI00355E4A45